MKIQELERKHFGDIQKKTAVDELLDEYGFRFDCWSEPDEYGYRERLLTTTKEGEFIKLEDMIMMSNKEFKETYPTQTAWECLENFRREYVILDSEESRLYCQRQILEAKKKLALELERTTITDDESDLSCGGF